MLSLLKNYVGETAAPLIFLVLFLVIVGGSLWITPRLAAWLDKRAAANKGYFDDMLEEDPNAAPQEDGGQKRETEDHKTEHSRKADSPQPDSPEEKNNSET